MLLLDSFLAFYMFETGLLIQCGALDFMSFWESPGSLIHSQGSPNDELSSLNLFSTNSTKGIGTSPKVRGPVKLQTHLK